LASRKQGRGNSSDLGECFLELGCRRAHIRLTAKCTNGEAQWQRHHCEEIVDRRARAIKADEHEFSSGLQQRAETLEGRAEREMVQHSHARQHFELLVGERYVKTSPSMRVTFGAASFFAASSASRSESMPTTCLQRCASLRVSNPRPHPTSRALRQFSGTAFRMSR